MTVSTIILAAGKGSRMRSPKPKILHKIAGKYLLSFSVELAESIQSKDVLVVVGEENELVTRKALSDHKIKFIVQKNQLGTGDAVKIALKDLKVGDTILKYGHDIGKVVKSIKKGDHVHVHNVKTKKW